MPRSPAPGCPLRRSQEGLVDVDRAHDGLVGQDLGSVFEHDSPGLAAFDEDPRDLGARSDLAALLEDGLE